MEPLGGNEIDNEVMRVETPWWDSCSYKNRTGDQSFLSLPWEDTHEAGRGLSQVPDHAGTLISASRTMRNIYC